MLGAARGADVRNDRRSSTTTSSPIAIEGSLDVIADACAEVGVRVVLRLRRHRPPRRRRRHGAGWPRTSASCAPAGAAWSACTPRSPAPTTRSTRPPAWPATSASACTSTSPKAPTIATPARGWRSWPRDDWLLVHCVHLDRDAARHDRPQPAVEHEQRRRLRRARRARPNPVVLGTDGIGADMLEEFRLAYVRLREDDVTATPDTAWSWLEDGYALLPRGRDDRVDVDLRPRRQPWHARLHPGRARRSTSARLDGEVVLARRAADPRRRRRGPRRRRPSRPPRLFADDCDRRPDR